MKRYLFYLAFLTITILNAQQDTLVLGFNEYLGYVKKYHPIAKQAQLAIPIGQANLMKARGGFDPKIEVDYERKEFKGDLYWDRLNGTFKIPSYFGIEFKGGFEQTEGTMTSGSASFSPTMKARIGRQVVENPRPVMPFAVAANT